MKISFEKKTFVRDWILRTAPKPEEVEARVEQAETVWAELDRLGYGDMEEQEPKQEGRDSTGFQPAYDLARSTTGDRSRQQLEADLRHWEAQHKHKPKDWIILKCLNLARAKLDLPEIVPAGKDEAPIEIPPGGYEPL